MHRIVYLLGQPLGVQVNSSITQSELRHKVEKKARHWPVACLEKLKTSTQGNRPEKGSLTEGAVESC